MEKSKQWESINARDNKLLAEHKAGDATALPKLIKCYLKILMNANFGFWRNRQDAEDATQNQIIELMYCLAAGKYKGNTPFGAWLIQCVRNSNCNKKRKKGDREEKIKLSANKIADTLLAEDEIIDRDIILLNKAIAGLKPKERKLFLLRAVKHLSFIKIAKRLKITVNAASQRYNILLTKLKKILKKKGVVKIIYLEK